MVQIVAASYISSAVDTTNLSQRRPRAQEIEDHAIPGNRVLGSCVAAAAASYTAAVARMYPVRSWGE
jgi:hypothetical protein